MTQSIRTYVSSSTQQGLPTLLQMTAPSGDPFSQDWVVCPHPEGARWVSQMIARERSIRAQLEVYPTGRWVSELQGLVWPRSPQLPTPSQMTWATLNALAELAIKLPQDHELSALFGDGEVERGEDIDESSGASSGASSGERADGSIGGGGYEASGPRRAERAIAGRRLQAAQAIARRLRRLLLTRPHWLQAWASDDASASETPLSDYPRDETPWPALWRAVSNALGPIDQYHQSAQGERPTRWSDWLQQMCERAASPRSPLIGRVRRIIFFGHHRYDAQTLALARACAERLEVGFITIDPRACGSQQGAPLGGSPSGGRGQAEPQDQFEMFEATLKRHAPLLLNYGQGFTAHHPPLVVGESTHQMNTRARVATPEPPFPVLLPPPQSRCELTPEQQDPRSLLQHFQRDLSRDEPRPEAPLALSCDLRSMRFHSSYSEQRQVEDLYQTLLATFRRDPSLKPRDVLVLCPNLERFIPMILAVFSGDLSAERSPEEQSATPVRLCAEISHPHGQNPFSELLVSLLTLSAGRLYRYDVFELLKNPLVSARFRLSIGEILQLEQWTRASGVRWGLDSTHRSAQGLNEELQHTWEFGLDRLMLGVLMGEDTHRGVRPLYQGLVPLGVGERAEEELLDRFCEFFEAFKGCRAQLTRRHTPADWCDVLIDCIRALSAASSQETRALRQDVESDLYRALKRGAPVKRKLTPRAVRALIEDGVGRQRVVLGAGRDAVRFYPLDQAYSVSARVICLLDASEGTLPQRRRPDLKDPTRLAPLPSDLDPTREQLCNVISSVLAARDQVHIFYSGQRGDGETRPPAPLVTAIQDELRGRYRVSRYEEERARDYVGDRLIDALTTRHPLHSFSARNFIGDASGSPTEETLSHEPLWLEGALAWRESMIDPHITPPFSERGLNVPAYGAQVTRLDTLKRLLKNPSEFFLRRGVGMRLMRDEELSRERELLELDGLQNWSLKRRVFDLLKSIDERLADPQAELELMALEEPEVRREHLINQVRAEGLLPIGKMGEVSFDQALEEARSLFDRFNEARALEPSSPIALTLDLPSGRPIRIESEERYGEALVFATPSNHQERVGKDAVAPRGDQLIEPWLYHVALSAAGVPYQGAQLIARDGQFSSFPTLDQQQAIEVLERWTTLLEEGSLRPLRFDPALSWRWLSALTGGATTSDAWEQLQEAGKSWRRRDDEYVRQTFGGGEMWGVMSSGSTGEESGGEIKSEEMSDGMSEGMSEGMNEQSGGAEELGVAALSLHPEFERCARAVFGELAQALAHE